MRTARITTIVLIIVSCISFGSAFQASSSQRAAESGIAGLIVDVNESRVVGATVKIENSGFKRIVKSDSEGQFEVEIPAGTYQITVEQPGFKKFYLPTFRVGEGTRELVNIHLDVAPPKLPLKVKPEAR